MFSFLLWKEMVQSLLNQHLTVIAKIWTVILVINLIRSKLLLEDVLVLQGPSSRCQWENISQLQIMLKIQILLRSVFMISTVFKLESEETGCLLATGLDVCLYVQILLYSIHYCLHMGQSLFRPIFILFLRQKIVEITPQRSPQWKQRGAKRKLSMTIMEVSRI